jgi:hypothetical protein
MKTTIRVSILSFLLIITARPCFAMMDIENVTRERAEELGIELRVKDSGPREVWVELELKP